MNRPTCFISYSWDSDEHSTWVRALAERLQENGVQVLLDQWDLTPGSDLLAYMETSIRASDFVLLVCTPQFAQKADLGRGGVGYEKSIVTGEIFSRGRSSKEFIPLLRSGGPSASLPSYLMSKVFIDFRNETQFASAFEQLLRHIHQAPRFLRPALGTPPSLPLLGLRGSAPEPTQAGETSTLRYCNRCGAVTGKPSQCTGGYSHHQFVLTAGPVYCVRCGAMSGEATKCTGEYSHHNFQLLSRSMYCNRCGAVPGVPTLCTGGYPHHQFVWS